uniref:Secreted peptide n=1 Tax=Anopheles braziliensis TaxID=58242 RepID=A0A2M3ZL63_9DIPT
MLFFLFLSLFLSLSLSPSPSLSPSLSLFISYLYIHIHILYFNLFHRCNLSSFASTLVHIYYVLCVLYLPINRLFYACRLDLFTLLSYAPLSLSLLHTLFLSLSLSLSLSFSLSLSPQPFLYVAMAVFKLHYFAPSCTKNQTPTL